MASAGGLLAGLDFNLRTPKGAMAALFCGMALPCLLRPELVLRLAIAPRLQPATPPARELAHLLMRCFGAQALLSGVAIAAGTWTPASHRAWVGAIVPFFAFDALAYRADMLTPLGAVGDALGNVAFVACSALAINGK